MNKFKVGDRVRVITNVHGELGKVFVIETVEGSDEVAHESPYRDRGGYWHKASELELATEPQPPPADAPAVDGENPPADWTPPPPVGTMVMFDKLLTQLSGNLSSSALQMLRTHFAAEHSMRTGVEAEAEALREQLAAAQAALMRIRDWQLPTKEQSNYSDAMLHILQVETDNYRRIAVTALQNSGGGE